MRTGAILLYKIPRVVTGENTTFAEPEHLLRDHGVDVFFAESAECHELMTWFITTHPEIWNEDIGESPDTRHRTDHQRSDRNPLQAGQE
jgi:cytosine deaminase